WSYEMNLCRRPRLLAAVTFSLGFAACGRVPGQFEILNDQVPSSAGGGCTVPVSAAVYEGEGRLDLSIVRSNADSAYLFFPLIENNLPGGKNGAQDPNQIQLSGFNIDITPLSGTSPATNTVLAGNGMAHFRTPWSGGLASGGGQLSAIVDAFPVALAQQLFTQGGVGNDPSATLNLSIQAIGTTTFGTEMQSDPFNFPLEVCVGCLVANVEACPFASAPANPGNACNPAQDDFVDCCTQDGALLCPPPVASK
ncbi:MAG TPA: hypothetical protein VLA79_00400, partial [Polyangia bacterium]|nr:hypothetical protein [Polyangia bacterium]